MAREDAIEADGKVVEVLTDTLYQVELANGHRLLGHVSGRRRLSCQRKALGDIVKLEMSPYDLSKGRIIVE